MQIDEDAIPSLLRDVARRVSLSLHSFERLHDQCETWIAVHQGLPSPALQKHEEDEQLFGELADRHRGIIFVLEGVPIPKSPVTRVIRNEAALKRSLEGVRDMLLAYRDAIEFRKRVAEDVVAAYQAFQFPPPPHDELGKEHLAENEREVRELTPVLARLESALDVVSKGVNLEPPATPASRVRRV